MAVSSSTLYFATPAAFRALEPRLDPGWLVLVAEPAIVEGGNRLQLSPRLPRARPPSGGATRALRICDRRLLALEGGGKSRQHRWDFRSATALGADGVLLDPACGDPFYRKAVRTSMGAVLRLPTTRVAPWLPGLAALRDMGFTIVALSPTGRRSLSGVRGCAACGRAAGTRCGRRGPRPEHRHHRGRGRDGAHSRRPSQRLTQHRRGRIDRVAAPPAPRNTYPSCLSRCDWSRPSPVSAPSWRR